MPLIQLKNFASKAVPVSADIIYAADSTNSFNEVKITAGSLNNIISLTGPITSVGSATSITPNAITYAGIQQASSLTLIGNPTGSLANISEITLGSGLAFTGSVLNTTGVITSLQNNVYVAKNGLDTNSGSFTQPFLTIAAAMASITTASISNVFNIIVANGTYTEASISLKPFVNIVGNGTTSTVINSASVSLSASYLSTNNASVQVSFLAFQQNLLLNFTAGTGTGTNTFYFNKIIFQGALNLDNTNSSYFPTVYIDGSLITSSFNGDGYLGCFSTNSNFLAQANIVSTISANFYQFNCCQIVNLAISNRGIAALYNTTAAGASSLTGTTCDLFVDVDSYTSYTLAGGATSLQIIKTSTAHGLLSSYVPTNYTAVDDSVYGAIAGIDNKLGTVGGVTSITAGTGLTGGTITTSGTIALSIPVAVTNGGTGLTSTTINQVLYSSSANTIAGISTASNGLLTTGPTGTPVMLAGPGSSNHLLKSNTVLAPTWTPMTYPTSAGTTGQIFRCDGTNIVYSTATFADTYTASNLLYSNGSNNVTGLSTANNGTLVTDGSGVPSISSTLPTAVQNNITSFGTISSVGAPLGVAFGGTGTSTSFTTGSVVYAGASGIYSQDNSNFFWDSTNHRLGIGITNPTNRLVVSSTSTGIGIAKICGGNGANGDNWWIGFCDTGAGTADANDRSRIACSINISGTGNLDFYTGGAATQTKYVSINGDTGKVNVSTLTASNIVTTDASKNLTSISVLPVTQGGTGLSSTTVNQILYSSATNTISGLATANAGALVTDGSGVPSIAASSTAGQVLTSNGTGSAPTWQSTSSSTFINQNTTSFTIAMGSGYVINNGGVLCTGTLPATAAFGTIFTIAGSSAGGWKIAQNAGQLIHFGSATTTTGTGGFLQSNNPFDQVQVICVVANTTFVVMSSLGNIVVN